MIWMLTSGNWVEPKWWVKLLWQKTWTHLKCSWWSKILWQVLSLTFFLKWPLASERSSLSLASAWIRKLNEKSPSFDDAIFNKERFVFIMRCLRALSRYHLFFILVRRYTFRFMSHFSKVINIWYFFKTFYNLQNSLSTQKICFLQHEKSEPGRQSHITAYDSQILHANSTAGYPTN